MVSDQVRRTRGVYAQARGGAVALVSVLLLPMLGACNTVGGTSASGTPGPGTPGARGAASPTARVADTPTQDVSASGTPSPFEGVRCVANATSTQYETVVQVGELQLSTYQAPFFYSNNVQVPDGTPLAPVKVARQASGAIDIPSGWFQPTNPGALVFRVCNLSSARSYTLRAVSATITALSRYTGQLNQWDHCQPVYSRSYGLVDGCGDSGWQGPSYWFDAAFASSAGVGTTAATVRENPPAGSPYVWAFPVTIPPGKGLELGVVLKAYPTPGTYRFSFGVTMDGQAPVETAQTNPVLFAPVAHSWDGKSCQSSAMQSQIPPATNPPTYYICPQTA